PTATGSAGGNGNNGSGGYGGDVIHFTVNGTLQLDGKISADGATGSGLNSGGGSGGSVYLTVGTLSGAGLISANGGAANGALGGGGGGGRVAIWFNTNLFSGAFTARGGAGYVVGGAGTIYLNPNDRFQGKTPQGPQLIVDNGGQGGTNTLISTSDESADLTIGSGAAAVLSDKESWNSLVIASNASLGFVPTFSSITLNVLNNLTVQASGAINLDGQGFPANQGAGAGVVAALVTSNGTTYIGGGGGHGGEGSEGNYFSVPGFPSGGSNYDSFTEPVIAGSGGGAATSALGSAGGGALHLIVGGALDVNGRISANGTGWQISGAGGGAGGSLWLSAATLSGSGTISANGGNGEFFNGGGGAGGLIAVYFNTNQFTGTFSAQGGEGSEDIGIAGGAGGIFLKTNSANFGQLTVDNGGSPGANTPLDSLGKSVVALNIGGSAGVDSALPLTFQSLDIAPDGNFYTAGSNALDLTVLGDARVDGAINADFAGFGFGFTNAPGAGQVDAADDGSGGGYGGAGGASLFGAPGGDAYG
ncbi:MAG: hypothetical protein ACREFE_19475, partial [Limisphaerales bacterium]